MLDLLKGLPEGVNCLTLVTDTNERLVVSLGSCEPVIRRRVMTWKISKLNERKAYF